jgi:beta-1,4-mannosyltransferase
VGLGFEVLEEAGGRDLVRRRFDVWHIHWPEYFLCGESGLRRWSRCARFVARLIVAKARGTKVAWTIHNLEPHDQPNSRTNALMMSALVRFLDLHISLGPSAEEAALARYPRLRFTRNRVIPHGHYRGAYPDTTTRDLARHELGLDPRAPVYLFLGQIRPYKNVLSLMRVFGCLREHDARLVVAGLPSSQDHADALHSQAVQDPRVSYLPSFVEPEKVQLFLRAADVMVLPYQEILNSGAAILALSFETPVVVPLQGSFIDLKAEFGPEWVYAYRGSLTPADLAAGMANARSRRESDLQRLQTVLAGRSWEVVAALTADAFRDVCASRPRESRGSAGRKAVATGGTPRAAP